MAYKCQIYLIITNSLDVSPVLTHNQHSKICAYFQFQSYDFDMAQGLAIKWYYAFSRYRGHIKHGTLEAMILVRTPKRLTFDLINELWYKAAFAKAEYLSYTEVTTDTV